MTLGLLINNLKQSGNRTDNPESVGAWGGVQPFHYEMMKITETDHSHKNDTI